MRGEDGVRHIDLFSGIGGFALAAKTVWGGAYENVLFCDNNRFCQEVLKKNFGKDVRIYDDIRTVSRERLIADTNSNRQSGRKNEINAAETNVKAFRDPKECYGIDLLTGGFPCQPFSQAGKRRGTEDDRYLWPEMLRVISEFKPSWIVGENVAGLLSMAQYESAVGVASETDLFGNIKDIHTKRGRGVLYGIIGNLEQIGYSVQVFVIPACAVNAPHRRDRVWIVAHAGHRDGSGTKDGKEFEGQIPNSEDAPKLKRSDCNARKEPIGDTTSERCDTGCCNRKGGQVLPIEIRTNEKNKSERHRRIDRIVEGDSDATYARSKGLERGRRWEQTISESAGLCRGTSEEWDENWVEVATELCGVDDGVSIELDGFKLTKSKHREERLKALGNAIVPQVAIEIFKAIKEASKI